MNVHELKQTDPKRYEREYWKWVNHMDHDWWEPCIDGMKAQFKAEYGIDCDNIYFNLGYSQGDYACVEWNMRIHEYMKRHGLDAMYPALYTAALDQNTGIYVTDRDRGSVCVEVCYLGGGSYPSGIFQHLDEDTWDELIYQQWVDADLELHVREFSERLNSEAYKAIQAEYEYLTSDEQFEEWCEANEEEFDDEVSC